MHANSVSMSLFLSLVVLMKIVMFEVGITEDCYV